MDPTKRSIHEITEFVPDKGASKRHEAERSIDIPIEIVRHILTFCDRQSVHSACLINKKWSRGLRNLKIYHFLVWNSMIQEGTSCDNIACITSSYTKKITNKAIAFFASLTPLTPLTSLTSVALRNCQGITAEGIAHLSSLINLTSLRLECGNITDQEGACLGSLINLKSLHLAMCQKITGTMFSKFEEKIFLTSLEFFACKNIQVKNLYFLQKQTSLTSLSITDCGDLGKGTLLGKYLPFSLTAFKIIKCSSITDAIIDYLSKIPSLTSVGIDSYSKITNEGKEKIKDKLSKNPYGKKIDLKTDFANFLRIFREK